MRHLGRRRRRYLDRGAARHIHNHGRRHDDVHDEAEDVIAGLAASLVRHRVKADEREEPEQELHDDEQRDLDRMRQPARRHRARTANQHRQDKAPPDRQQVVGVEEHDLDERDVITQRICTARNSRTPSAENQIVKPMARPRIVTGQQYLAPGLRRCRRIPANPIVSPDSTSHTGGQSRGWTELHSAAQRGDFEAVRLLLERGADPNAREEGDNTTPLHWAAAGRHLEIVGALLDAGGDVHGVGDLHEMDAIGWATFFHAHEDSPNELTPRARETVALLVARGARHHIFSAICTGDLDLIRSVVAQDSNALDRRMSKFEQRLTPVHFAISRKRYDIVDLLIELGADLEAKDRQRRDRARGRAHARRSRGRAPASGRRRQCAVGIDPERVKQGLAGLAASTAKLVPMIMVPDVGKALNWYLSIGFKELASYGEDGVLNFAMVSFGRAELMINMHGKPGPHDVSLWFYTDQIDELYRLLKGRQFHAAATGEGQGIEFVESLYEPFYGGRQFGIRDLNGFHLYSYRSASDPAACVTRPFTPRPSSSCLQWWRSSRQRPPRAIAISMSTADAKSSCPDVSAAIASGRCFRSCSNGSRGLRSSSGRPMRCSPTRSAPLRSGASACCSVYRRSPLCARCGCPRWAPARCIRCSMPIPAIR